MRFSDLDGLAVGLWGLGLETRSFARHLSERLPRARIAVVVEDTPGPRERLGVDIAPDARVVGAEQAVEALAGCDVLVRSPGVSIHRAEVQALTIPVVTATGLWLAERGGRRVIGVSGTKGKSTTATALHHLVTAAGETAELAGNIGRAALDLLDAPDDRWVIVELSSYQIADLQQGPEIAVLTNLYREHLNWHLTEENYRREKLRLLTLPGVRACVVRAAEWAALRAEPAAEWAALRADPAAGRAEGEPSGGAAAAAPSGTGPAERGVAREPSGGAAAAPSGAGRMERAPSGGAAAVAPSGTGPAERGVAREPAGGAAGAAASAGPKVHVFGGPDGWHVDAEGIAHPDHPGIPFAELPLRGRHNAENLCAALAALEAAGLPLPPLPEALRGLRPLRHRLETVVEVDGVLWVDDSISTTPESAIAAVETFAGHDLVLLAGGEEREQDYAELGRVAATTNLVVLGLPTTGARLVRAAREAGLASDNAIEVSDMTAAVEHAARLARPGTAVLLSPAAPSFNAYRNFEERGDHFAALARAVAARPN